MIQTGFAIGSFAALQETSRIINYTITCLHAFNKTKRIFTLDEDILNKYLKLVLIYNKLSST